MIPNFIPYFNIYDIFHNWMNELIIIMPSENPNPPSIHYVHADTYIIPFQLHKCSHKLTYVYTLNIAYCKKIKLIINNFIVETHVNQYPDFKNEIIFSTIVKNEDKYIRQWIDFHSRIGVTRFIIYDNSNQDTLAKLLKDYIANKKVVLIRWEYPYRLPISGISGQTTQQNHSIYAFKTSKYIGLFDVDEYVNMQKKNVNNIGMFLEEIIKENNIDTETIGSFQLLNKMFYNPRHLPEHGTEFLKITDCDEVLLSGREKNFVIPTNVNTFAVHMITEGKPMYKISPEDGHFNHYYFLNKNGMRGCYETPLHTDDSIKKHAFLS